MSAALKASQGPLKTSPRRPTFQFFPLPPPVLAQKRRCDVDTTQSEPKRFKPNRYPPQSEMMAMNNGFEIRLKRMESGLERMESGLERMESVLGLNSDTDNNIQKLQHAIQDAISMLTVMCKQVRSLAEDHNRTEPAESQSGPLIGGFDDFLDYNQLQSEDNFFQCLEASI